MATDLEDGRRDSNWTSDGQDSGVPRLGADASNGAPNDHQNPDSAGDYQHPGDPSAVSASNGAPVYREKQLKVPSCFSVFCLSPPLSKGVFMVEKMKGLAKTFSLIAQFGVLATFLASFLFHTSIAFARDYLAADSPA